MAQVLTGAADLHLHGGRPELAATLLGAIESILGLPEPALPDWARVASAARDALGPAGYAASYAGGLGATMHDVTGRAALA